MTNRALHFEQLLQGKKCPGCGHARLVQRRPLDYNYARCMSCGKIFKVTKKVKRI